LFVCFEKPQKTGGTLHNGPHRRTPQIEAERMLSKQRIVKYEATLETLKVERVCLSAMRHTRFIAAWLTSLMLNTCRLCGFRPLRISAKRMLVCKCASPAAGPAHNRFVFLHSQRQRLEKPLKSFFDKPGQLSPTKATVDKLRQESEALAEQVRGRQRELTRLRDRIKYMRQKLEVEEDIAPLTLEAVDGEPLSPAVLADVRRGNAGLAVLKSGFFPSIKLPPAVPAYH
jgi:hypothetical protein